MRTLVACLVATAALVAATADVAHACSCAPPEPRSLLAQADGAFVGRLEQRRDLGSGRTLFTFRVERSVKGQIGSTVDVETASNGASCGIETTVGTRIGLFLERAGGHWTSSLCWQVDADDLLAALGPLPPPTGRGPVVLVVGSRFGPVRTIALDALGRTLAYGRGAGVVTQLSICPGGRRMAEVVQLGNGTAAVLRELPRLRPIRRESIVSPRGTSPTGLRCESPDGSRLLVFHSSADRPGRARLERLAGARRALVWRGTAIGAALTARTAFVSAGQHGTRLVAIELATGEARALGRIPSSVVPLVASPSGARLAGVASSEASRPQLMSVSVRPFGLVTRDVADLGEVAWADDRRFAFFGSGGRDAQVYTPSLDVVASFGWTAYRSTIVGSAAYGIGFDGVHRVTLPSGPERLLGKLPSPVVSALVPVPR